MIVIDIESLFLFLFELLCHLDVVSDLLLLLVAVGVEGVVEFVWVEHEARKFSEKSVGLLTC